MIDNLKEKVGNNIQEARKEQGLTQQQLAIESGISRAYLGRIETQGRNISIEVLAEFADALEMKMCDLLPEE